MGLSWLFNGSPESAMTSGSIDPDLANLGLISVDSLGILDGVVAGLATGLDGPAVDGSAARRLARCFIRAVRSDVLTPGIEICCRNCCYCCCFVAVAAAVLLNADRRSMDQDDLGCCSR